jgi:hypothetical protein
MIERARIGGSAERDEFGHRCAILHGRRPHRREQHRNDDKAPQDGCEERAHRH